MIIDTETRPAQELRDMLRIEGYKHRYAGRLLRMDQRSYARVACETCGHVGLVCESWFKARSYRGLAVCPQCSSAVEY